MAGLAAAYVRTGEEYRFVHLVLQDLFAGHQCPMHIQYIILRGWFVPRNKQFERVRYLLCSGQYG